LPALDAKIVAFPTTELAPNPALSLDARDTTPDAAAESHFHGGSLRGLFWALLLEGVVIVLAAGVFVAWRMFRW
jgi:hypothetical protein